MRETPIGLNSRVSQAEQSDTGAIQKGIGANQVDTWTIKRSTWGNIGTLETIIGAFGPISEAVEPPKGTLSNQRAARSIGVLFSH